MNEKLTLKINETGSDKLLSKISDDGTKEYIAYSKKLLDDFKKMQSIIQDADGPDISIFIKVAQKNLTSTAMKQSDEMLKELQLDFSEKKVQLFIEQSITLITSVETANYLYGDMIDVDDIRRYISGKATKMTSIRIEKLIKELEATKYEDKRKLTFIVENMNLCMKLFEYAWDICPQNFTALRKTNKIITTMIKHRVKLGLDNDNVDILNELIEKNANKVKEFNNNQNKKTTKVNLAEVLNESQILYTTDEEPKSSSSKKENGTALTTTSGSRGIQNTIKAMRIAITNKFIDMSTDVIKSASDEANNDFLNVALQKFYSIIGAIETINYLKGDIVNKKAVSYNISMLLSDMIFSNYTTISNSWKEIQDKSIEDYNAYAKEVKKYCDILTESYDMCNDNIDALKKCVTIENDLYVLREEFKFSKGEVFNLNKSIEDHMAIISKHDQNFTISREVKKEEKKKQSFWAKIFK